MSTPTGTIVPNTADAKDFAGDTAVSGDTPQTPEPATCPAWCVNRECNGDHWSEPGCATWPAVRATGWSENDTPDLVAHPVWGALDGLSPAVGLWIDGERIEHTIDMTPAEAEALGRQLIAAAKAVRRG